VFPLELRSDGCRTDLGIYLVKNIVEAIKGTVTFKDTEKGIRFLEKE
jgi:sensor histidine kinase regulating citrate/malate metabolism